MAAKDLYVALGVGALHLSGNLAVGIPSVWDKLSALLQIIAIGFALLAAFTAVNAALLDILFVVTGLVTAITCLHYVWCGVKVFSVMTEKSEE